MITPIFFVYEGGRHIHPSFYKFKHHFSLSSHHSNKMRSPPLANLIFVSLILFFNLLTISIADIPGCNSADQAVLLQLKAKIKSPKPGIGDLSDWDPETNCCDWNFIGCDSSPGSRYGRVTAVTISGGSGLVGQIPEVIGNLPYLEEIMFSGEPKLTGPLPKSLSKLKHLELIYLSNNALTGNIPAFLGKLKRLREVDISGNRFTGAIPATVSNLTKLKSFNVSSNKLCGPIPSGLSKFSKSSFVKNKCLCGPPLPACK